MATDLIIAGMKNYGWNEVRHWVNSIKQSGFKGDIVLAATNISVDTIQKLEEEGVILHLYGDKTDKGYYHNNQNAPHVDRFFHIWEYLESNPNKYRYVVTTDARDVVFQKNPIEFLSMYLKRHRQLVCASEGLLYKDEPWGMSNMEATFFPAVASKMRDKLIYNVGTIAGYYEPMKDLLLQLYTNSINRPVPVVDQAVFNFMIHHFPYDGVVYNATNAGAWAAQLGTTLGAVEAGAGDLGIAVQRDPSKKEDYIKAYRDIQPVVQNDLVTNGVLPFFIVHQWDRVPAIRELVERKYGGGQIEIPKEENFIVINTGN